MTTNQVSAALRPFYFNVHPDRFGQHPKERTVNENSLKVLNEYFDNLLSKRSKSGSVQVCFYLKNACLDQIVNDRENLKLLQFSLSYEQNPLDAVHKILSSCSLSTKSLDEFHSKQQSWNLNTQNGGQRVKFSGYRGNLDAFWIKKDIHSHPTFDDLFAAEIKLRNMRPESLINWLNLNVCISKKKTQACKPIREDIIRLCEELKNDLKLTDLCFDSEWDALFIRGALISFKTLAAQHPKEMLVLRGRKLIFRRDSGVNLEGVVILNLEDVRHHWINLLRSIARYDQLLHKLPSAEAYLSSLLKDITIVHSAFRPVIMIREYLTQLEKLTKSLIYYKSTHEWPSEWPESLKNYKLVVDCDSGPLMLSQRGEFIIPASCPAQIIVDFITKNLIDASKYRANYNINERKETSIVNRCLTELEIESIDKIDNVTPELMIQTCERLLQNKEKLLKYLCGSKLRITHYYSILHDGTICIPYNWSL